MVFITTDSAYIHETIVIAVTILGKRSVKLSAFFAKLFDATLKIQPKLKINMKM